eukprot:1707306-Amphidinium_carterae.1
MSSSDMLWFLYNNTPTATNGLFSSAHSLNTQCLRFKVSDVNPRFGYHMRNNMSHWCQEIPDDGRADIPEDNNDE